MRVEAENGATAGKFDLAKRAKAANLDAIHDTVHEMARDEARHGKAFEGLLKRYFAGVLTYNGFNLINSNMRCIEISRDPEGIIVAHKINSNMRCIEIR